VTPKVSVVIPSLNEEKTIGRVVQKAKEALKAMGPTYEIIAADNSTDKTPEIARSMRATIVTPDRRGYGYVYLYAFRHARGDIIVMADADDTYDMRELPKLLQPILEGKADLAICTRLKGKILKGAMPRHNPLITWLINRFYKVDVSDSQCGFRAFTRQALEKLKLEATGMEFATDMLIKARHAGLRIVETPITYYPRAEGAPSNKKLQRRLAPRRMHPHLHPQTPLPIPRPRTNHPRHSTHSHSPHKCTNRLQPRHPHLNNWWNSSNNRLRSGPPTSQTTRHTIPFNYRRLPLRDENVIALTAIALGIEVITSSFVLKSMS
jgi:hypothetical protein